MERLTSKEGFGGVLYYVGCFEPDAPCGGGNPGKQCGACDKNDRVLAKLAAYEDAEEQGRMVVLPCKAGDTLYSPRAKSILEQKVEGFNIWDDSSKVVVNFECDNDCKGCPHGHFYSNYEAGDGGCDGVKTVGEWIGEAATYVLPGIGSWIDVNDRIPEIGRIVLIHQVYGHKRNEQCGAITVGRLHTRPDHVTPYWEFQYYRPDFMHGTIFDNGIICPGNEYVTHWMPFPANPTVEMEVDNA